MKKINLVVALVICCLSVMSQEVKTTSNVGVKFLENKSWSEVLRIAEESDKLIFMDCYTSWCGPCKALAKEVFPQPVVGDFFNKNFINVTYDMEKGEGKVVYDKYKDRITNFPTLLVFNSKGEIVHKLVGYHKAEALIEGIKPALTGRSISLMELQYQKGRRGIDFMSDFSNVMKDAYEVDMSSRIIKPYVESLPLDSLLKWKVFVMYKPFLNDIFTPQYLFYAKNVGRFRFVEDANGAEVEYSLLSCFDSEIQRLINSVSMDDDAVYKSKNKLLLDSLKNICDVNVFFFSKQYAKLIIFENILNDDFNSADNLLTAAETLKILGDGTVFFNSAASCIIDKSNNKKLILKYMNYLINTQESNGIYVMNNYDAIARAYYKLGKTKECLEANKKYEDLYFKKSDALAKSVPSLADGISKQREELFKKQRSRIGL